MSQVDIVITCTGATTPVISKSEVEQATNSRKSELHILDLGLPRDVEPSVADIPNVDLFIIEDLQRLETEHRAEIADASEKAEEIVAQAAQEFIDDVEIQPLLRDIGESAERIRIAELQRTLSKLRPVDDTTREALDAMTRSMVKRILADPIQILKRRNR
jgi:glutamyl-tRNA reductase